MFSKNYDLVFMRFRMIVIGEFVNLDMKILLLFRKLIEVDVEWWHGSDTLIPR